METMQDILKTNVGEGNLECEAEIVVTTLSLNFNTKSYLHGQQRAGLETF